MPAIVSRQKNNSAKLLLSAVMAANPSKDVRDPDRALSLTDSLEREYGDDPTLWEIRAAALASRQDYKSAVKAQAEALDKATRLGWDFAQLQHRQYLYTAHQPWTGDLLNF